MLIEIDFRDKRPLYEQISGRLEELILCGVISADEALPSVRALAMDLSINPNTIQKAYDALEQRGFCYSVAGRGRFAAAADEVLPAKKQEILDELGKVIDKASKVGFTEEELTGFVHEKLIRGGKV
ncbi:GntR family transcriptional regulator [Butyrivibrio sp. AE3004]|uniref:GntR family transcriptional regulator n=1 Tax=Butyrivibrio sp. AE3004 TaxID=1506994 RepID=UPI0006918423|nr:GntR family transcriptional regulator [Butyrivibrio sp. AE3004]